MVSREQISAAMDGEEVSQKLIRQISSDKKAQEEWEINNLVGTLLRNEEMPDTIDTGFMDRFNAKLAQEPVHNNVKVEPVREHKFMGVLRYFGQAAIAASVAACSIVGLNYYSSNGADSLDQVLNTTPYGGTAAPVKANIRASSNSLQVVPRYQLPSKESYEEPQEYVAPGKISNKELAQIEALLQDHVYQSRMQRQ